MPVIELLVDHPLPRWQADCARRLAAGAVVRLTAGAGQGGRSWRAVAGHVCQLKPVAAEPEASTDTAPADVVIDLAGRGEGPDRRWRLLCGDGRPLAAPFPFADQWCRPGGLAAVLLVDEAGRVLRSAHLSVQGRFYTRLVDDTLKFAALLPALAWRDRLNGIAPSGLPGPVARRGGGSPWALIGGGQRYARQRLVDALSTDLWRIGLVHQPIHAFLDPTRQPRIDWLTRIEAAAYCADPIAHPCHPGEIWWERYDYLTHHGVLQRARLGSAVPAETVDLGVSCHMSFPGMVKLDGRTLLIPEMSESGTTRLFSLDREGHWECLAILPVPGVDPVLFRWEDRLWLGLTRADLDKRSNFCLWHATSPSGPWTEHDANPVKIDVRSARSAGPLFRHNGALYRPAQDCTLSYGKRVVINRVIDCTPTRFREEVAAVVGPQPDWTTPHGLHTLAACGEHTLIDAKVTVVSTAGLAAKLGRRVGRSTRPPASSHRSPAHPR